MHTAVVCTGRCRAEARIINVSATEIERERERDRDRQTDRQTALMRRDGAAACWGDGCRV